MFLKVREAPWQGGKSLGSRPHAPSSLQAFVHIGSLSGLPFLSCAHMLTGIFRDPVQCKCPLCREGFSTPQLEGTAAHSHPLVLLSPMALISVDPEDPPSLDGSRVATLNWHSVGVPYSFAE